MSAFPKGDRPATEVIERHIGGVDAVLTSIRETGAVRREMTDRGADAIRSLNQLAATANRLAKKAPSKEMRAELYEMKVEAISTLLEIGAASVDEVSIDSGLATVRLGTGRRLHVPIRRLSSAATEAVSELLTQLAAASATDSLLMM